MAKPLFDSKRMREIHAALERGEDGVFAKKPPEVDLDAARTQLFMPPAAPGAGRPENRPDGRNVPSPQQSVGEAKLDRLIDAIENGDLAGVKSAVRLGADVNGKVMMSNGKRRYPHPNHCVMVSQETPLQVARRYGHSGIIDFLTKAGARD